MSLMQTCTSHETGLIDRFDPKGGLGSNVRWKSEIASGISTPIVMDGRVFTIVRDQPGTSKDAEKVIALDADSGDLLWENVYNAARQQGTLPRTSVTMLLLASKMATVMRRTWRWFHPPLG